jgi:hypothetical protein
MYEKEKRRSEMWVAKYEKDIGPLEYAAPVTAQPAPVQEPVAIVDEDGVIVVCNYKYKPGDKLYTTPPAAQKPWVGLTDDEIRQCETTNSRSYIVHARAIEAKLKEKNHDQ